MVLQRVSVFWMTAFALNLQQPVDSDQEADVLSGQPHRREDQKHGHQSSTGDTGCSHAGQGGSHTM